MKSGGNIRNSPALRLCVWLFVLASGSFPIWNLIWNHYFIIMLICWQPQPENLSHWSNSPVGIWGNTAENYEWPYLFAALISFFHDRQDRSSISFPFSLHSSFISSVFLFWYCYDTYFNTINTSFLLDWNPLILFFQFSDIYPHFWLWYNRLRNNICRKGWAVCRFH